MKLVFLFALLNMSLAHEGHNKAPGTEMAPHGGVMQGTSQYYFELVSELVSEVSVIKLYPLNHDLKAIPIAQLAVSATSQVPKKLKESVEMVIYTPGNSTGNPISVLNSFSVDSAPQDRYGAVSNLESPLLDLINAKYILKLKKDLVDKDKENIVFEEKSVAKFTFSFMYAV